MVFRIVFLRVNSYLQILIASCCNWVPTDSRACSLLSSFCNLLVSFLFINSVVKQALIDKNNAMVNKEDPKIRELHAMVSQIESLISKKRLKK